ncbi:helix-turn-helix transcriptional regulator [Acinetobacter sp. WCHAc060007]|uniref:helix-turn-helix transcriptional regulator n=1 Tax=Acinetobacter sp. WCHAc060007 TaxID=2419605 RepID=UPI000EA1BB8F|nr:helix-turn-helix domain-containing protein [Acinetobacter sp. WCHAc060007]RKG40721.1 AlpA family phage regulatory protein [Acinetobacter sp. WCHAc060007]
MIVQFKDVKDLTSSPAKSEKIHVYKSGENKGKTRKLNAKPARTGILPVSEKTVWTWVREGKFPKPFKMNGRTVWRLSDVETWIAEQESKATILKEGA